jgi:prepilin-type N-terminal cleavage/methylation domain-containing protein/prepilin-type processing-associated H-X9-DG protein
MKKAFTLIELLVVIAIIAILAAILFPVFAQAKAAAKGASELSNTKQLALATLIYSGDSDDMLPQSQNTWNGDGGQHPWIINVQPYTKSFDIFRSPFDVTKLVPSAQYSDVSWMGVATSFGANALVKWNGTGNECVGAMTYGPAATWPAVNCTAKSQTQINKVAETILIAPMYSSDLQKRGHVGNPSAFAQGNQFTIPGDNGSYCNTVGCWSYNGLTPAGTNPANGTWPYIPDGMVSMGRANVANFAFADGHSKSMKPSRTNPDTFGQPTNNMWDITRS